MDPRILVINPTATATLIAVYDGEDLRLSETIEHSPEELAPYDRIWDQYLLRKDRIAAVLEGAGIATHSLAAAVGVGGLLRPVPGGIYRVNERMLEDLRSGLQGEHASNLGGILAYGFARPSGKPSFIVDPVSTDELLPEARLTGIAEIGRTSLTHALNIKAMARRAAAERGVPYESIRLVAAHLGMGISVSAHAGGQMIDANNANEGGPFSPERCGTLPAGDLVKLCFTARLTEREVVRRLTSEGGLQAHLGTKDYREVERRIEQGDPVAHLVYEAMCYQVAKEIGAMAVVLSGRVDAVVITGPLAASDLVIRLLAERVSWVAPLKVYPGGDEMQALAAGGLRALRGQEEALEYV